MTAHTTSGLRCPMGTCRYCDGLRRVEQEARCAQRPEPRFDVGTIRWWLLSVVALIVLAAVLAVEVTP